MTHKFLTLCLILLLLGAVAGFSDTVMIYVHAEVVSERTPNDLGQVRAALEDGLMAALFKEGHIVFNLEDDGSRVDSTTGMSVGLSESVDWVVLVDMQIARTNNGSSRMEGVVYSVLEIGEERVADEGILERSEVAHGERESVADSAGRVGRRLADTLLGRI